MKQTRRDLLKTVAATAGMILAEPLIGAGELSLWAAVGQNASDPLADRTFPDTIRSASQAAFATDPSLANFYRNYRTALKRAVSGLTLWEQNYLLSAGDFYYLYGLLRLHGDHLLDLFLRFREGSVADEFFKERMATQLPIMRALEFYEHPDREIVVPAFSGKSENFYFDRDHFPSLSKIITEVMKLASPEQYVFNGKYPVEYLYDESSGIRESLAATFAVDRARFIFLRQRAAILDELGRLAKAKAEAGLIAALLSFARRIARSQASLCAQMAGPSGFYGRGDLARSGILACPLHELIDYGTTLIPAANRKTVGQRLAPLKAASKTFASGLKSEYPRTELFFICHRDLMSALSVMEVSR